MVQPKFELQSLASYLCFQSTDFLHESEVKEV